MKEFKEFEAKTVDAAIDAACRHYGVERSKLEIEILRGESTGIFGFGKKNALVQARRRASALASSSILDDDFLRDTFKRPSFSKNNSEKHDSTPDSAPSTGHSPSPAHEETAQAPKPEHKTPAAPPKPAAKTPQEQKKPAPQRDSAPAPSAQTTAPQRPKPQKTQQKPSQRASHFPSKEALEPVVTDALHVLLQPLTSQCQLSFSVEGTRVKVRIENEDDPELLIGREGQTIAALQYILNRIVSRHFETTVQVHLDTANYRDRQDEEIRDMALSLGSKAKRSGRTHSTRALSSYHRRIVHLALQDDPELQTNSIGEGPLKRVLIEPTTRKRRKSRR